MEVHTNLELAVRHVVEYLNRVVNLDVKVENWTNNEVQKVKISCRSPNAKYKELIIMGVETIPKLQCMISFLTEDESLSQFLLKYKDDLMIDAEITYPLKYEEHFNKSTEELRKILDNIGLKINSKDIAKQFEQELKESNQNRNEGAYPEESNNDPLRLPIGNEQRRTPDDMPKFEDEYEIQRHQGDNDLRLPGRSGLGSYGDRDLYPTGNRYPDLNHPGQMPGLPDTSGGMIFDPFSDRNRPGRGDPGNKPPGWIPGVKYDDPYGRPPPGFPGGPGGSFGPGGFGSGGFGSGGFV